VLCVNLNSGSVINLDLLTKKGDLRWKDLASDPSFHSSIRGISLILNGHRADLPIPKRFNKITFSAELIKSKENQAVAERITACADGVVLSLTMYLNGRSGRFRIDLDKKGRPRFRPS
jgi:hypothetical protein